ncbi:MAG TPA: hypothetical protein VIL69_08630 [Roseomonas sp.]|jgi:hypothetical protein
MRHLPGSLECGPPETLETFRKIATSYGFVDNLLRSPGHAPQGLHMYALCDLTPAFGTSQGGLNRHFSPRQATEVALPATYHLFAASLIVGMGVETEPPEGPGHRGCVAAPARDADGQVQGTPMEAGPRPHGA